MEMPLRGKPSGLKRKFECSNKTGDNYPNVLPHFVSCGKLIYTVCVGQAKSHNSSDTLAFIGLLNQMAEKTGKRIPQLGRSMCNTTQSGHGQSEKIE